MTAFVVAALTVAACKSPTAPTAGAGGGNVLRPLHAQERSTPTSDDIAR